MEELRRQQQEHDEWSAANPTNTAHWRAARLSPSVTSQLAGERRAAFEKLKIEIDHDHDCPLSPSSTTSSPLLQPSQGGLRTTGSTAIHCTSVMDPLRLTEAAPLHGLVNIENRPERAASLMEAWPSTTIL